MRELRDKKRIGVIGGKSVDKEIYSIAYKLGKEIAKRGHIVVCGGLGGVMEAVSRGSKEEGGISIGLLPGNSIENSNPYITIPVATGIGIMRNLQIVYNSDIIVAVDGSYGTLSEIAYSLALGKTVLGYKTWNIEGIESFNDLNSLLKRMDSILNAQL